MGVVWRAQDAVLGREVAVKDMVFPPTFIAVRLDTSSG
jgi:hypothetical protein